MEHIKLFETLPQSRKVKIFGEAVRAGIGVLDLVEGDFAGLHLLLNPSLRDIEMSNLSQTSS